MDNDIRFAYIPIGHSRFRHATDDNGNHYIVICSSDREITPGNHTKEELWENQNVVPAYGIKFDSLDHIKAYADALYSIYSKSIERERSKLYGRTSDRNSTNV